MDVITLLGAGIGAGPSGGVLEDVSRLGPIATGAAALVALGVGVLTIAQRTRADRRDQWWKRAEWAIGLVHDDGAAQIRMGLALLGYLASSRLAGRDEARMMETIWSSMLDRDDMRSDL